MEKEQYIAENEKIALREETQKSKEKKLPITYEIFSKYRTILMGIATLCILFFHYTDDCRIFNYNFEGFNYFFNRYVSSTGVDIFLFLSGLGLYYSWKKNSQYKQFISKRLKRIIIPYLLISIPAFFIRDVLIRGEGLQSVLAGVTFYDFLTTGDNWFWYILMIGICYLIYPWIFEIVEENKSKIKSQLTMLGVFTFSTVIAMMLQQYDSQLFSKLNIIILRIPIFIFGSFIGRASYEKRAMGKEWLILGIISLICLPLRETNKIILVRYVLGMINLFLFFVLARIWEKFNRHNIKLTFINKIIEWFGKYSLEIYLTHVIVRSIMCNLGYRTCQIRYYLLMVIISIVLSVIVKKLTELIIYCHRRIYEKFSNYATKES